MESKDLKFLFDNIKDGDALFFYHKQWWAFASKVIALFTGEKVDHVGVCLCVKRVEDAIIFNFSEQTFHAGGRFDPYGIVKSGDKYMLRGFSADSIYYGQLIQALDENQQKVMLDDAEKQVGKQYGSSTLLKTLNWYSNMFTKKQTAADQLRVCSTHAQIMYEKADVLNKNNESSDNNFYSPAELMDSTIFNLYKISDY